jgi:hypothetical protein
MSGAAGPFCTFGAQPRALGTETEGFAHKLFVGSHFVGKWRTLWARPQVDQPGGFRISSRFGIYRVGRQDMKDKRRWLFEPHANLEFGEIKVYSRFWQFLGSNVACAVIRLPLDMIVWTFVFYLGHRFGVMIFG